MKHEEAIETLQHENALLTSLVEKLTRELSELLTENIRHTHAQKDHDNDLTQLSGMKNEMDRRYKLLAENVNEMISIVDPGGHYTYINQKAAAFHGLPVDRIIGRHFSEVMSPVMRHIFEEKAFQPVIHTRNKISGSVSFQREGGVLQIDFNAHPVLDDNGVLIGVVNVTQDVSEGNLRRIYEEIDYQINFMQTVPGEIEEMLRTIFTRLCQLDYVDSGGIYVLNEQTGNFELLVHYNISMDFVRMATTYTPETPEYAIVMQGLPVYDLFDRASDELRWMLTREGMASVAIIPMILGDKVLGSLNLASSKASSFLPPRTQFIENVAMRLTSLIGLHKTRENLESTVKKLNETITDLRVKQQILIQKSKMESLGEFSAGMAHEINQPLVIISLSVENIQQKLNSRSEEVSPAYLKRKFDAIQINIRRIQQIIDNLRVFARDQSGILFEKVSVAQAVRNAVGMVAPRLRNEGITLQLDEIGEDIRILGNIFKLEQVLLNLISNSVYAVNKRKEQNETGPFNKEIRLEVNRLEDRIAIMLTDNGIGIPEENQEKLFTPFFTTKIEEGGTGLGLPIVYGIIKEMNGDIRISSVVNQYTTVTLLFPGI